MHAGSQVKSSRSQSEARLSTEHRCLLSHCLVSRHMDFSITRVWRSGDQKRKHGFPVSRSPGPEAVVVKPMDPALLSPKKGDRRLGMQQYVPAGHCVTRRRAKESHRLRDIVERSSRGSRVRLQRTPEMDSLCPNDLD